MWPQQLSDGSDRMQHTGVSNSVGATTIGQPAPPSYGNIAQPAQIAAPGQVPWMTPQIHEEPSIGRSWDSKALPIDSTYAVPPTVNQHPVPQGTFVPLNSMHAGNIPVQSYQEQRMPFSTS